MKAWQVTAYGEPEQMQFVEVPTPKPQPGQVLIRNHAAALNFFDILLIQGKYQVKPAFPFTPGRETAGTVEAVGDGVSGFAAGDRVLADVDSGTYAEYSIAEAGRTFPVPKEMGMAEASGYLIAYQTAHFALKCRAGLQAGENLLVHAGASGVGMAAIQLGKAFGARVLATAGSPQKLEFCRAQGADEVIDYRDPTWVDRVKESTGGRGADVIFDPVGGDIFDLSTKCIAPQGRLLVVGFAAGRIPTVTTNRILLKNISIVGAYWGKHVDEQTQSISKIQRRLDSLYERGEIRPVISKHCPLAQAPHGLREMAERRVMGKAVLLIDTDQNIA